MQFFDIVPQDLQQEIVFCWVTDSTSQCDISLLHILSILDIACCNKSIRQAFLFLAAHPIHPWADCYSEYGDQEGSDNACTLTKYECAIWLAKRKLGLKSLVVTQSGLDSFPLPVDFALPTITSLKIQNITTSN